MEIAAHRSLAVTQLYTNDEARKAAVARINISVKLPALV